MIIIWAPYQQVLLDIMKKRHKDLIFCDQDLLNIYLDSNYFKIPKI